MNNTHPPSSYAELRDQFQDRCVLAALDNVQNHPDQDDLDLLFLDEDSGRIYRVLEATRGSPDSGWFVIALAGPHPDDDFERQRRVHDSDTHRVLIINTKTLTEME